MTKADRLGARTLRQWRLDVFAMEQVEFAKMLGVSLSTYRAWEQGVSRPRPEAHRQMAEHMEIEPSQIRFTGPKAKAVA